MSFFKYYHLFTQFRSQLKIIWNAKIMHKDTMFIRKIEKNESSIRRNDIQSVTEILLIRLWWYGKIFVMLYQTIEQETEKCLQ